MTVDSRELAGCPGEEVGGENGGATTTADRERGEGARRILGERMLALGPSVSR